MGAVWLAFRADLRHRWRSWLTICLLISLVGGFVLAATAAGRRTQSAYPQFVAAHGFDAIVYAGQPVPQLATLPDVVSATELVTPTNGQPTCRCTHQISPGDISVVVAPSKGPPPFSLLAGHLPNPADPHQVLASFTLQHDAGVRIGTVIRLPLYSAAQASAISNAIGSGPSPKGPTVALRVVGIEATELEFPTGTSPVYLLYATKAFAGTVIPKTAVNYYYFVRLRHGAADLPRFGSEAGGLNLGTGSVGFSSEDAQAASVEGSIHPQAVGWWALAALAALVGLAVVGQTLARQSMVESEDYPTMAALGIGRRQLLALGTSRNLSVALVGAAGAVAIAFALSPLAPLGEARRAEASTGATFDTLILSLGAVATVVVVLALGLWPAVRAAHTLRSGDGAGVSHPSAVVARLAAAGAPPSAVIGVRNALERRSDGATIPVGSTLFGTVLAVVALCGTAVFGASLSHLTSTPRLYGDPFQLSFNPNGGPSDPTLLASLEHNPAVTGITRSAGGGALSINGTSIWTLAASPVRGPLLFSNVEGRLPVRNDEIGLGAGSMRTAGTHLGSMVQVTAVDGPRHRTVPYRVVSQVSFPVTAAGGTSMGTGALITIPGLERLFCPPGPGLDACRQRLEGQGGGGILASVASGPRGQAAINHYLDVDSSVVTIPTTPTSLVNFGQAVNFPAVFGAMLAVFGAATMAHLLVVSVTRRRREIGLLRVLGFVGRQIVATVAWQATTLALVGVVVGIPLGLVVGRAAWKAFAANLGAVPVSVAPVWLIGAVAAGIVVVANVIAAAPALLARKSNPGSLLREPGNG